MDRMVHDWALFKEIMTWTVRNWIATRLEVSATTTVKDLHRKVESDLEQGLSHAGHRYSTDPDRWRNGFAPVFQCTPPSSTPFASQVLGVYGLPPVVASHSHPHSFSRPLNFSSLVVVPASAADWGVSAAFPDALASN